ncbi:MAG: hypothetical protein KA498_10680 [Neisseriaceae bacterium]|nr:hypothetical protein [Neisseriaceae bacterium]
MEELSHKSPLLAPPASEALKTQVHTKREHTDARVFLLDHEGETLIIKRLSRTRFLRLRRWLSRWIYRRLDPRAETPTPAPRSEQAHEVNRLLQLAAAGVKVPRVIGVGDDWVAMSHVGEPIEKQLAEAAPEVRWQTLEALTLDLAQFHQRGCWHGGAQIRNVTQQPDGFYRFDFEEDLDRELPLSALQAIDVLMFFSSLMKVKTDADVAPQIERLRGLLVLYQQAAPNPKVLALTEKGAGWLKTILPVLKHMPRQGGKERLRVLVLLGLFLPRP